MWKFTHNPSRVLNTLEGFVVLSGLFEVLKQVQDDKFVDDKIVDEVCVRSLQDDKIPQKKESLAIY